MPGEIGGPGRRSGVCPKTRRGPPVSRRASSLSPKARACAKGKKCWPSEWPEPTCCGAYFFFFAAVVFFLAGAFFLALEAGFAFFAVDLVAFFFATGIIASLVEALASVCLNYPSHHRHSLHSHPPPDRGRLYGPIFARSTGEYHFGNFFLKWDSFAQPRKILPLKCRWNVSLVEGSRSF
jgi:hypothetical protein